MIGTGVLWLWCKSVAVPGVLDDLHPDAVSSQPGRGRATAEGHQLMALGRLGGDGIPSSERTVVPETSRRVAWR